MKSKIFKKNVIEMETSLDNQIPFLTHTLILAPECPSQHQNSKWSRMTKLGFYPICTTTTQTLIPTLKLIHLKTSLLIYLRLNSKTRKPKLRNYLKFSHFKTLIMHLVDAYSNW